VLIPAAPKRSRSSGSVSSRDSAAATSSTVGSGIRQFSPSTQKSRLPWASVHTTAPPVAIDSSSGSAKPSWVEVSKNTDAWLKSSLTCSSLGEVT